jgi:hypothetical protein
MNQFIGGNNCQKQERGSLYQTNCRLGIEMPKRKYSDIGGMDNVQELERRRCVGLQGKT